MISLLRTWHRRIGLAAALLALLLSVTGILLNHTGALRLDERYVRSEALLDWYGIGVDVPVRAYRAGNHYLAGIGGRLYWDRSGLGAHGGRLRGAVPWRDLTVVALQDTLLLLTRDGELVEKLTGAEGVPAGLQDIGLAPDGNVVVKAAQGVYEPDIDTLEWRDRQSTGVRWAKPVTLPAPLRADLLQQYRGGGLTIERILLDLHSGRILGGFGVYVMDIAAVLLVILAISGLWMWLAARR